MEPDGALIGGRYLLGELLGTGGSASVFAAEDADGGAVAVKLLHPHLCADDVAREAFLREAERASGLDHPNVVRVHGAGLHDAGGVTMPWIALDLLDGPTLREWVEQIGPLGVHDAAAVLDGVLAGLAHAHAQGLIHRDLTPQNVILHGAAGLPPGALTAGMVRILDFGLADVTGRATVGADVLLAGEGDGGQVVGNAHFMSPEQAQGLPVRAVSDIYQAGAMLCYALTGEAPFPRPSVELTMHAHVSAPPPVPSSRVPAARPLDRVVTRALAKTPARRFRTADDFRAALTEAVTSAPAFAVVPLAVPEETTGPTTVLRPGAASDLDYLSPALPGDGTDAVASGDAAPGRPNGAAVLLGVGAVAILLVAAVGAAFLGGSADAEADGPRPQPSESPSTAPPSSTPIASPPPSSSPSPSAEPSGSPAPAPPTQVDIPTLFGTLADAEAALAASDLRLGNVNRVESPEAADRVLGQQPQPGTRADVGAAVDVTVASGRNSVPEVNGMSVPAATAVLLSAGFDAVPERQATTAAVVTGSDPAAGAVLKVGVTIVLKLAPEPTPGPSDTPAPSDPGEADG